MRFLISALVLTAIVGASPCPNGYDIAWKGICVRKAAHYIHDTLRNVTTTALAECGKDGAFPPKLDSDEARDFMISLYEKGDGVPYQIIGVVCNVTSKKYHWADGTPITKDDVPSGSCDSNVPYFNLNKKKIISNENSYEATGFGVWCYKPVVELNSDDDCYDFDRISATDGTSDSCVRIATAPLNHDHAEDECYADFSDLASIHSKQANDFIRRKAASMGYLNGLLIGGHLSNNNEFTWDDNSTVDYTNFAPGFPLLGAGPCIAMQTTSTAGQWINTDCSKDLPFACTRAPDAQAPSCGSRVYQEGDIIYSPGYPHNASEPCDYELQVPERKIVQLEILNLEANACCDHLTLHEGTAGGRLIAKLTGGNHNGRTYRTFASNIMHLSWQPNGGENVRGFAVRFRGL